MTRASAELLQGAHVPCFREVGQVLASLSGVDFAKASTATVRAWEARGLALIALSRGDRAQAERIMAPSGCSLVTRRSARSRALQLQLRGDVLRPASPP